MGCSACMIDLTASRCTFFFEAHNLHVTSPLPRLLRYMFRVGALCMQRDLPPEHRYGSKNGMTVTGSEVTSPVMMWLHALEALFRRLKVTFCDFVRVVCACFASRVSVAKLFPE